MNREVTKERLFEHVKTFQAIAWPGESNDQVVERLVRFAGKGRDTEWSIPGIKWFFPRFLDERSERVPAVSDVRDGLGGACGRADSGRR